MITRRQLLKRGAAGTAGLMFGGALLETSAIGATSVAASLTPYVDRMPTLLENAINGTGGGTVNLTAQLIYTRLSSQFNGFPPAPFFGYVQSGGSQGASYLGPTIVARAGVPLTFNYTNNLPKDPSVVFGPAAALSYTQFTPAPEVRMLTHQHGGFVAGIDDGSPFSGGYIRNPNNPTALKKYDQSQGFQQGMTQCCIYPNDHPATLLWYHDHYMGATRMNVVAGMAAGYVLRDGFEDSLYLPTPPHELPLVVQDRQLNANGTLLYPTAPLSTNGPWIGEYFGDIMLVNGKVWPFVEVEPCLYRFRVLNGCNARILNLNLQGVPMTIIGTEGGFLPQAVGTNKLVMTPAERYDVLVDFTGLAGKTFNMTNNNPPAPISTPAPSLTTVMQFRVLDKANNPPTTSLTDVAAKLADNGVPGDLRVFTKGSVNLNQTTVGGNRGTRMITLNEVGAGTSAWKLNLNATPYGATSPKIEQLSSGWDFEDWVFVNMTPDTHPMHTHLFDFEVMGRYNFDAAGFSKANGGKNGVPQLPTASLLPYLKSGLIPPDPTEMGFKDTVKANPGQVTVVRAKFNLPSTASGPQQYVHHCHIVEHEDNDMMERFIVS